jgi:hypothetical protein
VVISGKKFTSSLTTNIWAPYPERPSIIPPSRSYPKWHSAEPLASISTFAVASPWAPAVGRDAAPRTFLSQSRSRKVARVPFNFVSRPYAPNKALALRQCDKYTNKVEGIGPMRIVLDTHLDSDIDDAATQRSEPESARNFCHISCKGQASRIAGARTGRREGRD